MKSSIYNERTPTRTLKGSSGCFVMFSIKFAQSGTELVRYSILYQLHAVTTAAKCTTAGVRTYTAKFSNTAFATQTKTESIAATGHTEVTDNAVSATCTTTGLTAGSHCSVCNTVLTAQTTTPALGHDIIKDNAVAATCTKTGLTEGEHCSRCDYKIAQTTTDALGHSYGTPTYTWTGTTACKASRTCSRCSNVESQNGTITNAVTTAAKCTTAGVRTYTAKFSNTAFATQTKTESIAATGHTEVTDNAVSATCTTTGLTAGSHCSVCNTVLTAQTTTPALGHDIIKDNAVAATCTKTGLTEGEHCSRCDYKIAQTTTDALGHEYNSVTKEATCTEGGSTITTCSRCGDSSTTTTEALGHNYTAKVTTEATCTTNGVKTYTCSRCSDSYTESIAATGHIIVVDKAIAPTCSTTGLTEGKHCSSCNKILVEQILIGIQEHTDANDDNACDYCNGFIVPDGGTYYVGATSTATGDYTGATAYTAGDVVSDIASGDIFVYGNYEYRYKQYYSYTAWAGDNNQSGWGVRCIKNMADPGPILNTINGKAITSMFCTFKGYTALTTAPVVPSTVTDMTYTFRGCSKLTSAPILPSGVKTMSYTFGECTSLNTYDGSTDVKGDLSEYTLPSQVTDMYGTFYNCTSLTNIPNIPSKVTLLTDTFRGCTGLVDLSNYIIPSNVTNLGQTFLNCTGLTTAPVIPKTVTSLFNTFRGCTSLSGTITIHCNPIGWTGCLYNTKITSVVGDTTMAANILRTKTSTSLDP